jgi:5-methylcytosine-specific restriction endonuclease McrA
MSSSACLVLNRNFVAIDVSTWERAISLIFQGAAQAVDDNLQTYDFEDWAALSAMMSEHPNGFVHSPNMKIAIPAVIRLTQYSQLPKNEVVFTKRNLMERDGHRCAYCGKKFSPKDLNFDHVVPKSKGGKTDWMNIVTSCFPCNSRKADRTPAEAGLKLLIKPHRPKHQSPIKRMIVQLPLKTKASWQKLLDRAYWDSELQHD